MRIPKLIPKLLQLILIIPIIPQSYQVNYLDTNMGKLHDLLHASGLWNNTLVVVSSDNGGPIGAGDTP